MYKATAGHHHHRHHHRSIDNGNKMTKYQFHGRKNGDKDHRNASQTIFIINKTEETATITRMAIAMTMKKQQQPRNRNKPAQLIYNIECCHCMQSLAGALTHTELLFSLSVFKLVSSFLSTKAAVTAAAAKRTLDFVLKLKWDFNFSTLNWLWFRLLHSHLIRNFIDTRSKHFLTSQRIYRVNERDRWLSRNSQCLHVYNQGTINSQRWRPRHQWQEDEKAVFFSFRTIICCCFRRRLFITEN